MDEKMKREFVFVFQYVETSNDVITKDLEILSNPHNHFAVSRFENNITIVCQTLRELADIAIIATEVLDENNRLRLQRSLGEKLVEFIN